MTDWKVAIKLSCIRTFSQASLFPLFSNLYQFPASPPTIPINSIPNITSFSLGPASSTTPYSQYNRTREPRIPTTVSTEARIFTNTSIAQH